MNNERLQIGYLEVQNRPTVNGTGVLLSGEAAVGNGVFNIVTPQSGDFILKKSYDRWIHGTLAAVDALMTKWAALGTSTYEGESLTLEFLGGTINNKIIPKTNQFIGQTTGVSSANLIYRDDGYGLQVANYVDFINEIFSDYGLSSRIYAGTGIYERFILDYATTEQFNFLFQETTNQWGGLSPSMYYKLYTEAPYNIADDYGSTTLNSAKYWTDL